MCTATIRTASIVSLRWMYPLMQTRLPLPIRLASDRPERNTTLILTDVIGASPANIAEKLLRHADTVLITGVNLPMVLTAVCHRHKAFDQLCALVKEAGSFGITVRRAG